VRNWNADRSPTARTTQTVAVSPHGRRNLRPRVARRGGSPARSSPVVIRPRPPRQRQQQTLTLQAESYSRPVGRRTSRRPADQTGGGQKRRLSSPTVTGCVYDNVRLRRGPGRSPSARRLSSDKRHDRHHPAADRFPEPAPYWPASRSPPPAAGRRGSPRPRTAATHPDRRAKPSTATHEQRPDRELRPTSTGFSIATGTSTPNPRHHHPPPPPRPPAPVGRPWTRRSRRPTRPRFFALTPRPITGKPGAGAGVQRGPARSATISTTTPIVFPGLPGASHAHNLPGQHEHQRETRPTPSLLGHNRHHVPPRPRTCSAYWIPSLLAERRCHRPGPGVTVYYGSRLADPSKTQPFPARLPDDRRGRETAKSPLPAGAANQFLVRRCGWRDRSQRPTANWPVCAPTADLTFQLVLPGLLGRPCTWTAPTTRTTSAPRDRTAPVASGRFPGADPVAVVRDRLPGARHDGPGSPWRRAWRRRCTATS